MADFVTTAGRMYVKNDSGDIVFDTDESLFVVTNYVTGSKTLPERSAHYSNEVDFEGNIDIANNLQDTDHIIQSVNSSATTVRGGFNVTVPDGFAQGAIVGRGTFNAGGTYMHFQGDNATPSNESMLGQMATYTFMVSSGNLVIRENIFLQAQPHSHPTARTTFTLVAPTFNYKLFVGAYV